ncbi:hypothetical protein [Oerskovia enterophila]|uniref:hypothetical protein n=1 Tax=Oerskovia enterophila TaxID=43678 RepID=UPI003816AFDE
MVTADDSIPLTLPTVDWLLIDGMLDNVAACERVGGDPRVEHAATSIRQAGWDQLPDWPSTVEGFSRWPAVGQRSTLRLTLDEWQLIVDQLERDAPVEDSIANDPRLPAEVRQMHTDSALRSRAIASSVRSALASPAAEE